MERSPQRNKAVDCGRPAHTGSRIALESRSTDLPGLRPRKVQGMCQLLGGVWRSSQLTSHRQVVKLSTFQALERFLQTVPSSYLSHIEDLSVTTEDENGAMSVTLPARTEAFISLLVSTPRLATLSLRLNGSLDPSVIAPFPYLRNLRKMSIINSADERVSPLYVSLSTSSKCDHA